MALLCFELGRLATTTDFGASVTERPAPPSAPHAAAPALAPRIKRPGRRELGLSARRCSAASSARSRASLVRRRLGNAKVAELRVRPPGAGPTRTAVIKRGPWAGARGAAACPWR